MLRSIPDQPHDQDGQQQEGEQPHSSSITTPPPPIILSITPIASIIVPAGHLLPWASAHAAFTARLAGSISDRLIAPWRSTFVACSSPSLLAARFGTLGRRAGGGCDGRSRLATEAHDYEPHPGSHQDRLDDICLRPRGDPVQPEQPVEDDDVEAQEDAHRDHEPPEEREYRRLAPTRVRIRIATPSSTTAMRPLMVAGAPVASRNIAGSSPLSRRSPIDQSAAVAADDSAEDRAG